MEGRLAYVLYSDPLLLYALTLTAILFGGIFFLVLTIIFKHGRRLKSQKIQEHFVSILNQAKQRTIEGKNIGTQISQINSLIEFHKTDIAYGWVRLLEKTPKAKRGEYIEIATQTNMQHCVPHCLNDGGIAEKCIALEAIGLSGFHAFTNDVNKYTLRESIAPYACIVLARLTGGDSISTIIESYELGFLSTTQALSALVEIPNQQIISHIKNSTGKKIPANLSNYLAMN